MNEENRKKVEDYLNNPNKVWSLAPLIFHGYKSNKEEFDPTEYSIEDMVERAIELSREFPSYNSEPKNFETYQNRSRSSLDIWRHIKYYYPAITIFDVMHALYNLAVDKKVVGLFCPDINRRIFRLTRYNPDFDLYMNGNWTSDEYDVCFSNWEDI